MKKVMFSFLMVFWLAGCYNTSDAENATRSMGFTDVEVKGHAWFACSEDDFYSTRFKAVNSKGENVSGAVCSGLFFKNSTVRF